MTYAEAVRQIASDFKARKYAYEQAELGMLETDGEFASVTRELRTLTLREVRGEKIDKKRKAELTKLDGKIRARLGLIPPEPHCSECGDSGMVGGKYCDCAVKLALSSTQGELGIALHEFAEVDYSVYGDKCEEYKKLFADIETICSVYPANKKRCLVIGGLTGNGKTYLAGCAAQRILSRGMSVTALSAFAANDKFLKYHTCFDGGKSVILDPLLDCSLLVIDDLGTESIFKNVTVEYLYQVINERNTAGKLTLITTNLTPDKLLDRYGERIYSRLFDKSLSYAVYLSYKDLRKAF